MTVMTLLVKSITNVKFYFFKYSFDKVFHLLFAFVVLSLIIHNRTRIRIPKDLPITLSNDNIIFYFYLISVLLFLIGLLVYNNLGLKGTSTTTLVKIIKDFNAQSMLLGYTLFNTIIKNLFTKEIKDFVQPIVKLLPRIYIIPFSLLEILPRLVILSAFIFDILFFHKLYYFYFTLFLLLIPLGMRFILFSTQITIKASCDALEEKIDISIPDPAYENALWKRLDVYEAFEYLAAAAAKKESVKYNLNIHYNVIDAISAQYNLKDNSLLQIDFTPYEDYYRNIFLTLIKTHGGFLYLYNLFKRKILPWITLIMLLSYLFGWIYIIYHSNILVTADFIESLFLINLPMSFECEEPFSGLLNFSFFTNEKFF